MKTYICKQLVELSRKDFDRINGLFSISFEDGSPEMEARINKLDAHPDTNPATLSWDFDDGSFIIADIHISDCSAYDDIRWYENETAYPETFDCGFHIDEKMRFDCVGEAKNTYVCLIEIADEKDAPMKVRCNMCEGVFDEKDIVYDGEEDKECCPLCGESGCLMDLKDEK